jgi:hypothetical protein
MNIRGNGMGSSLALLTTWEEWSIHCRKGGKLELGLSSLVWYKLTILERFIEPQNHHARRFKNTACAMSHNTMNRSKINPEQSKNLAARVIINA